MGPVVVKFVLQRDVINEILEANAKGWKLVAIENLDERISKLSFRVFFLDIAD